jgi:hypothetical protein
MQIIGIVALSLDVLFWETSHGRALPIYFVSLGILAALLALLVVRRRQPAIALSAAASLVNTAAVLVALWAADEIVARDPRPWIPFQSHKLAIVVVALVAPSPSWVGVVCIGAYAAAATAQYAAFPADVRAHLAVGEPWANLAFGACALGVYVHRRRTLRIEHEAMRAHAEAESLRRLARVSLAIRDLSNTQLQTLRLSTALLRWRHPDDAARIDQIERALTRLEELEHMLSRYEARTPWKRGDESFDPVAILAREGEAFTAR